MAALVVGILAWLAPFSPVGPSPFQRQRQPPLGIAIEVAGGKPSIASGFYKGSLLAHTFPPSNVVDRKNDEHNDCGDTQHTYWLLPDKQIGWVQIDLLQNYNIIKLRWLNTHNGSCNDRGTTKFHIALSEKDSFRGEEQIITSGSMPFSKEPSYQEILLPAPVTGRYVRFYVDEYYEWGGGLNELEIYEQAAAP